MTGVRADVGSAINYINGLHTEDSTDYHVALQEVESHFTDAHASASQTIGYFMSDGDPNEPPSSPNIGSTEASNWASFLGSNGVVHGGAIPMLFDMLMDEDGEDLRDAPHSRRHKALTAFVRRDGDELSSRLQARVHVRRPPLRAHPSREPPRRSGR